MTSIRILFVFVFSVLTQFALAASTYEPIEGGGFRATFTYSTKERPLSVAVAGSFNNWNPNETPLADNDGDGVYEAEVILPHAGTWEYKFVINGDQWMADPDNPGDSDEFDNSILTIASSESENEISQLTSLTIEYFRPGAEAVRFVWGVNNWGPPIDSWNAAPMEDLGGPVALPMERIGPNRFQAEIMVPTGSLVDYVFNITEPQEDWDNNGGEGVDFHTPVQRATKVYVIGGPEGPPGVASAFSPRDVMGEPQSGALTPRWMMILSLIASIIVAGCAMWGVFRDHPFVGRALAALVIALFAFTIRANQLNQGGWEIDEEDYVPMTAFFAQNIREGNFQEVIDFSIVSEHPRWGFALFAAPSVILDTPEGTSGFRSVTYRARMMAALMAALTAFLLTLRWPLAGVFWSFFGLGVFYTSLAYLDSPMTLFAVVCVLAFDQTIRGWEKRASDAGPSDWEWARIPWGWLALSAAGAGMTVSTKYLGAVAPIAVALGFIWWLGRAGWARWKPLIIVFAAYVTASLVVMVITDWYLWSPEILQRIVGRLTFHRGFSTSELVQESDFPWFQPFVWLWTFTDQWGGGFVVLDRLITVFGLLGVLLMFRKETPIFLAAIVTLVFLFLWPTKWPQYETIFIPWLCVGAHLALMWLGGLVLSLLRGNGAKELAELNTLET